MHSTHRGQIRCLLSSWSLLLELHFLHLLTGVHVFHSQVTQCTSSRESQERGHLPHFQLVPTAFKLSKLNQSSLPPAAHLIHCETVSCSTDQSVSTRSPLIHCGSQRRVTERKHWVCCLILSAEKLAGENFEFWNFVQNIYRVFPW